jgi:hypothetical protein
MNLPSRASCTVICVRGMTDCGSRNAMRRRSRTRAPRRAMRAFMIALRSASSGASAVSAASASDVKTSG